MSSNRRCFEKRSFSENNIFAFNKRLTNESWDFVYELECTQLAFTQFQGLINQHFETNFKMQSFTTDYQNRHPWMIKALRTYTKIKNAMHTKCIASATKDKTQFAEYNKIKKLLKSYLGNAEILYYSNRFNIHTNHLAKSWTLLKIIGTNSKASKNTTFTINNKLVTDSKVIANGFNNYFVSICPLLANDIRCSVNPMSYVSIHNSIVIVNISCLEKCKCRMG